MVCMAPTTVFDLFIISYGQAGASFVSYRHFIFFKSLLTKQLCPYLSSAGAYFFSSFNSRFCLDRIHCIIIICKYWCCYFFLINCRTVCDDDLNAISSNCPDLEQLDILGTRQVSEESVLRWDLKLIVIQNKSFYFKGINKLFNITYFLLYLIGLDLL